jgi:hypothetical protein
LTTVQQAAVWVLAKIWQLVSPSIAWDVAVARMYTNDDDDDKIERIIVLLSASPEGEARLPMPKGMAYKE